jgi:mycothiol synthase
MTQSTNQHSPQLVMRRGSLDSLPAVELPEGYSLRHFREGDQAAWDRIMAETFGPDPDDGRFERDMRKDEQFRPERVLLITQGDDPAASASAWVRGQYGPGTGYLHMVGTRPSHQGKRLGYLVSLAALHHLVEEGFRSAVLQTDDFRIPAIKTYLRLDFEPMLVHENQRQRWRDIFETLGKGAELCSRYAATLEGPILVPGTTGP